MVASVEPSVEAPPTAKRAAVQRAVLEATEALLAEGASYADLNIERIANRAGISRTAFYFYFRDKRELLMRLTADVSEQLYAEAEGWFAGDDDDVEAALRQIGELYREHAPLLRVIVEVSTYDDEVARFWRGLVQRFVDATRARLEAEGTSLPAEATAFALVWMTERAFHQLGVQDEPVAREELVEALAGIWRRTVYG